MSKCREAFIALYKVPDSQLDFDRDYMNQLHSVWIAWKAAWNVRGKVDAEICDDIQRKSRAWSDIAKNCKEAIAKENEK